MVRHERTDLNDPKKPRLRAWENAPLNRIGQLGAKLTAQNLKPYNPQMIYCSDLARDAQTAEILANDLGNIPYEIDFNLRTADMGELAGMLDEEAAPLVDKWYREPWWPAPSGESNNDFLKRWYPAFDVKFNLAREVDSFSPMVIVSHGRNLASIHARADGIPQWEAQMPLPGGIMKVFLDDRGAMKAEFLTETEPVHRDA